MMRALRDALGTFLSDWEGNAIVAALVAVAFTVYCRLT